jgi:hypothetical protein
MSTFFQVVKIRKSAGEGDGKGHTTAICTQKVKFLARRDFLTLNATCFSSLLLKIDNKSM